MSRCLVLLCLLSAVICCRLEPTWAGDSNARRPAGDEQLRAWLENMVWHHRFTMQEVTEATGLASEELAVVLKRFEIYAETRPAWDTGLPLLVLPYPGGRHPRVGFLEGAIRPQRETKVSVFSPWNDAHYVVLDIPEAIWWKPGERELLYLAHTHIPTTWEKRGIELKQTEWQVQQHGLLRMERTLPNGIAFRTLVRPRRDGVLMEMALTNGTARKLQGLDVQACVMLKGAPPFSAASDENKFSARLYVACCDREAGRWVITAWEPCQRVWNNSRCPCIHSDPRFPDCDPGKTVRLRGWLSFYQGPDIEGEFKRLDRLSWRTAELVRQN